ncbi:hypothetical protein MC885_017701 [Smutsia gigantea]|nr:hypothetical protein MC885_017701 [Smutsia gigantea]
MWRRPPWPDGCPLLSQGEHGDDGMDGLNGEEGFHGFPGKKGEKGDPGSQVTLSSTSREGALGDRWAAQVPEARLGDAGRRASQGTLVLQDETVTSKDERAPKESKEYKETKLGSGVRVISGLAALGERKSADRHCWRCELASRQAGRFQRQKSAQLLSDEPGGAIRTTTELSRPLQPFPPCRIPWEHAPVGPSEGHCI